MDWVVIIFMIVYINLLRWVDYRQNTSVRTFKEYWIAGEGFVYNLPLVGIVIVYILIIIH